MKTETIVLAGGCFWCTEAIFTSLKGVVSAEPGYAGGEAATATYEQVSKGNTGHLEVAKIEYDPDTLSLEELLGVFFSTHDATTPDRQGNDVGPQYNSAIFYTTDTQKERAEKYVAALTGHTPKPILTTVRLLETFYPAENYHTKYYEAHKDAPYCQLVIAPKLEKVKEKYSYLVKER